MIHTDALIGTYARAPSRQRKRSASFFAVTFSPFKHYTSIFATVHFAHGKISPTQNFAYTKFHRSKIRRTIPCAHSDCWRNRRQVLLAAPLSCHCLQLARTGVCRQSWKNLFVAAQRASASRLGDRGQSHSVEPAAISCRIRFPRSEGGRPRSFTLVTARRRSAHCSPSTFLTQLAPVRRIDSTRTLSPKSSGSPNCPSLAMFRSHSARRSVVHREAAERTQYFLRTISLLRNTRHFHWKTQSSQVTSATHRL